MLTSDEQIVARLVALIRSDEQEPIATLKREIKADFDERTQRAQQQARDNPVTYGLARWEKGIQDQGGRFVQVMRPVEWLAVKEQDIALFAREHHLPVVELLSVLHGQRLECKGWRAAIGRGSASIEFRDRSAEISDWQVLVEEDRRDMEAAKRRAEQAKNAIKPVPAMPVFREYKAKESR